jgi:large-conductance mechanosensitive channel
MILVRFFLIALIVYLLVRSFMKYAEEQKAGSSKERDEAYEARKVSKSIGEYVDFEDIKKDKS